MGDNPVTMHIQKKIVPDRFLLLAIDFVGPGGPNPAAGRVSSVCTDARCPVCLAGLRSFGKYPALWSRSPIQISFFE